MTVLTGILTAPPPAERERHQAGHAVQIRQRHKRTGNSNLGDRDNEYCFKIIVDIIGVVIKYQ